MISGFDGTTATYFKFPSSTGEGSMNLHDDVLSEGLNLPISLKGIGNR